ncbi:MAG: SMP-30/gluconolactonase/LRE family protein [Lentisphaeraceae bacterium]|nr:SMP-30/gluconolactonase/LRE family protein [Lentisphaeraceae bacterium]
MFKQLIPFLLLTLSMAAQDMPLTQVLLPNEGWEKVAEGYGHTDAAAVDAEGNFYFADVAKGTEIFKVSHNGEISTYAKGLEKISGMQFGPDGKLYCCQAGKVRQVISVDKTGSVKVLAKDVQPNDLVVTANGWIYVTETKTASIIIISPEGKFTRHKTKMVRPNGITLSVGQSFLNVSDHGSDKVWSYSINKDGSLSNEQSYMYLRTKAPMQVSKGDGMATDAYNRYYVTSEIGIQMYDPTGRMGGVILNPLGKPVNSIEFAGPELAYMYICGKDVIYRRKTKSKGIIPFNKPVAVLKFKK